MEAKSINLMIIASNPEVIQLLEQYEQKMNEILSSKTLVKSKQQYDELGEKKYDYDCILVSDAALAKVILQDQCIYSQKLKWMHSLLVGIDPNKFGNDSSVQLLEKLTVGIIGYGDIGFQCARMINKLLKMKVVGLKRSPQNTTQEHSDQVDEIIGFDQLDYLLAKSDFVVNCLPYTKETHELFDMRLFQKMKPTSVYVNIGRGQTGNENDLIKALQDKIIRAASLDVFYQEPLPAESPLWDMDNVIMTPHCADLTDDYHQRSMDIFIIDQYNQNQTKKIFNQNISKLKIKTQIFYALIFQIEYLFIKQQISKRINFYSEKSFAFILKLKSINLHFSDKTILYYFTNQQLLTNRNLQRYQNLEQLNNICNKALGY